MGGELALIDQQTVSYRHNPEDVVQNGRRHVDVNLLGMWWSAPVVVLRLRGMRR